MTVKINLTKGFFAIVDDCDADLAQVNWYSVARSSSKSVYAARKVFSADTSTKQTMQYLHRVVLSRIVGRELQPSELTDHINGNKCDCRRENLRLATPAQNVANQTLRSNNKSGFKGVAWHKPSKKWRAAIGTRGRQKWLGYFDDPADAHAAYVEAIKNMYGEFANDGTVN